MRLFAPVCSQTTSLQRCCSNFCFGQRSSRSPTRSKSTACKGCCGISAPSEQWVRLLQPLLPHSKGRWRAKTYSRSQMSEPLTYAPVILLTIKQFLVHICSEDWFLTQKLTLLLSHLERLGLVINSHKSHLLPRQQAVFLGMILDSARMQAWIMPERSLTIQRLAASLNRDDPPPEGFPEVTRLHGSHRLCNTSGPASHAAPSNLAQCPSSIPRLASGTVSYQDRPPLCQSCGPLDDLSLVSDRNEVRADLQEEGSHNRRIQLGLGRPVGGQSGVRLLVSPGAMPAYQLPKDVGGFLSPEKLPTGLEGAPRLSPVGPYNCGVLHQPPRWSQVTLSLQDGPSPPFLGTERTPLVKGGSCAGQIEHWHRYAVQRQCSPGRMGATSSNGSKNLVSLREGRDQSLHLRRQLSLPNILLDAAGRSGPRLAQCPPVRFSPDCPDISGRQADQRDQVLPPPGGPTLEEPDLVPRDSAALSSSPVAHSTEEGPSLAGERHDLASPAGAVEPSCLVPRRELSQLPAGVSNTILEARAPSTRRLYGQKWSVFLGWCSAHGLDLVSCDVSHMLTFLQELLDKGCTTSTLKVYVTAIVANHSLGAGQSIGKNDLIVRFLKGVRRLNPPRTVLSWDLSIVLRALRGSAELRPL